MDDSQDDRFDEILQRYVETQAGTDLPNDFCTVRLEHVRQTTCSPQFLLALVKSARASRSMEEKQRFFMLYPNVSERHGESVQVLAQKVLESIPLKEFCR